MTDLRTAAQQALEALQWHYRQGHSNTLGGFRLKIDEKALRELSAALAQQEEPAQEPYTGDVTRIMRDAGMTFHLGLPHKAVIEQMTRVVDLVYAEASIKAAQQFAAALAQQEEPVLVQGELPPRYVARSPIQAEPVEPVAWVGDPSTQDYASTQPEPDAYGYASRLAVAIWEKHYKDIAPQWKPLDDLMGVLTQIDNMTSGLTLLAQQAEPQTTHSSECWRWHHKCAVAKIERECKHD